MENCDLCVESRGWNVGSQVFLVLFLYLAYKIIRLFFADADLATFGAKIPSGTFEGKVVWIIGASSGIGEHLANKFASQNAKLILSARRVQELERVRKNCVERGAKEILVLPLDTLDFTSHVKKVETVLNQFGQIDYLINNSGRSQRSLAEDTEFSVDVDLFTLNVFGIISITKAVLPSMIKNRSGHIVVTSSVAGKMGAPVSATYAGTKHALQGYFDTLRMEVADRNITISMICPGPVVSEGTENSFTAKSGINVGDVGKVANAYKMPTERCVDLMIAAIANRIEESWISDHPILFFMYVNQYAPNVARWMGNKIGRKRVEAFKSGNANINQGLLKGWFSKVKSS